MELFYRYQNYYIIALLYHQVTKDFEDFVLLIRNFDSLIHLCYIHCLLLLLLLIIFLIFHFEMYRQGSDKTISTNS